MANHLDLEEQEQLDQLKHFWKQYGDRISWLLIAVLSTVAAWNGYQYWQRTQAAQAAAMYDEVERVVRAGDVTKAERALSDMKDRFTSTVYAQQAGLLVGKMAFDAGNRDVAKSSLTWVSEKAADKGLASIARLRLASLLADDKAFDAALAVLGSGLAEEFVALGADRKGDIFAMQGKTAEAQAEYLKAYKGLDAQSEYRRLVEVKLGALGASPVVEAGKPTPMEASK
jgi:predicted negative regulator of RcsB-dependent stress response